MANFERNFTYNGRMKLLCLGLLFSPNVLAFDTTILSTASNIFILGIAFSVGIFAWLKKSELNFPWLWGLLATAITSSLLFASTIPAHVTYNLLSLFALSTSFWLLRIQQSYVFNNKQHKHFHTLGVILFFLNAIAYYTIPNIAAMLWPIYSIMLALTLLVISRLSNTKIQSPLLANVTLLMWCVSLISINQYLFSEINFAHLNISLNVVLSAFFMVSIFLLNRASPLLVLATTHEKSVEDKLYYYAHDLITQLPNQQQALELFEHHLRLKATGDFIVLVCKPINFNDINTIIGHKNADLLLLQLAYCLQQKANLLPHLINLADFQPECKISRLQAISFMVIIDATNAKFGRDNLISTTCLALKEAIPKAFNFRSYVVNFELVFGAANYLDIEGDAKHVIACAGDAAIEAEKTNQSIVFYKKEEQFYTEHHLLLMEQLKDAINHEQLQLVLQPQIHITSHKIIGMEALIRWRHPEHGLMLPEQFIELAIQSGVIYQLTKWVIKQSCEALLILRQHHYTCPISINISSKEAFDNDIIDYLLSNLTKNNLTANDIIFEISESTLLASHALSDSNIERLKHQHIQIALDNFSGNYHVLKYLRKKTIQQIKLDCSSLHAAKPDGADFAILSSLLFLSRSLGIRAVGVGVENVAMQEKYLSMGGEYVQGYMFGKPGTVAQTVDWLKANQQSQNLKPTH